MPPTGTKPKKKLTPLAEAESASSAKNEQRVTAPRKRKAQPATATSAPLRGRWVGREAQPLAQIIWLHRDTLHANNYNPNHVAPVEMDLLRTSILEDGWTQPIVVRSEQDNEIVDGFHRWTLSGEPDIYAMTAGYVPCVPLHPSIDHRQQIMSTIRHNRARGSHGVLKMADIVRALIDDEHCSYEEVMQRLGMEWEEVDRLYDRGGMIKRGARATFNSGWVPQ